ncbi:MAG: Rrf2 family transcriptional regulator [Victivallales bacterium]|nr:Rrf2 family transcriptional regulator [Victivallales bacterium]MCF7888525.1 Rrf2 family transcriptional regulator [Victivallales bacterium]
MQLTTKTRYGLRILIQLAMSPDNKPVKGKSISEEQNITEPYMEQIIIPLKTAGFAATVRGCNGGYILKANPKNITVLEVMELFEGKIEFAECVKEKELCPLFKRCPTTDIWYHLSKTLRNEAGKITLESIVEKLKNSQSQEYVI